MNRFVLAALILISLVQGCYNSPVTVPESPKASEISVSPSISTKHTPTAVPDVKATPSPEPTSLKDSKVPEPVISPEPVNIGTNNLDSINEIFFEAVKKDLKMSDLYEIVPESRFCYEGKLKYSEKEYVMNIINEIRKLHDLEPVSYFSGGDIYTSKASMVIAVNVLVTHAFSDSLKCVTPEAKRGAAKSNILYYALKSEDEIKDAFEAIIMLMLDGKEKEITPGSNIGHRRWFLNPFLKYISVGRADTYTLNKKRADFATGMAIKVVDNEINDITHTKIDFVAYPYREYPHYLFKTNYYMSFSALVDKSKKNNNKTVDYSQTEIEIINPEDERLEVKYIHYDTNYQGLQNSIQWKADVVPNVKYKVKINRVKFLTTVKNYEYWFEIK